MDLSEEIKISVNKNYQDRWRLYGDLMYSLPLPVYTVDKDGYLTMFNDAAVELWGRRPEVGKDRWCGSWKIYESNGAIELPLSRYPLALAFKDKSINNNKHPLIVHRPDGSSRYFISYPELIFDSNDDIEGAINMLVDVTEINVSEEEKAKLAAIVQSSDDAIISKTLNGVITSWNHAAEKLFGYTEQEMIGESITKIIPQNRQGEEAQILDRLRKGERIEHFETRRVTKQGKEFDLSLTISPVKDSKGNIIGASKIARDISDRKRTDEINARLAAIVQSSDDVIISKTLDGIITSWNNAAEKLFGYTEQEMIGESITKIIPGDRLGEEEEILNNLKAGKRVEHFETKRLAKDGTILEISLTSSPIKDASGNIIGASKIARNITAEKKTQRLLNEKEERLVMVIEATSLGTWEYDNSKLFCSTESKKICGLPADANPDMKTIIHYIHSEDRNYFLQEIKAASKTSDGKFDLQFRIHRFNDHEIRWLRVQGKIFFNSNGYPERLIGTMLDISKEKSREKQLKESVELFQTMADNVPAMIWMSGTDKFEDYFNKTWLEFTGRTLEEESNERWLEGIHPDDVQKCIDTYNASFKEQKEFYTEYRLRRYDGEYRWISDNSVPRFSPEGKFLGFISACMDIDDQKRFREKIQESELLFKTISNASPAALWMTNENEENIFISDTWLKWTAKNYTEVIGQGWISSVDEEDKGLLQENFHNCFVERRHFKAEFRFANREGETRWGLTEGYPFFDFSDSFVGYAGSITDITEIKKLEQRKDDFIKMASHELKTPITSINGYVQLLLNIYNEADEQRLHLSRSTVKSSLNTISKQVVKLTRLITELLDLSKIESGKLELHKTQFYLKDLVEETVQDVRQTASKHAIIVHSEFDQKVWADKDRIGQVILNLLTNAIKYSPDADNIEVFIEGNKNFAMIKVKDHGIGIDKKDQGKIFERFYRVEGKKELTFPGFGIGLFIANEIVQRHDGSISVQSEKGKGSVFTIILPIDINNVNNNSI